MPESLTSMRPLLAPKCIFRSVEPRLQAMATAKAESARLISTRSGSQCTWITQTGCRERRLIGLTKKTVVRRTALVVGKVKSFNRRARRDRREILKNFPTMRKAQRRSFDFGQQRTQT